MDCPHSLYNDSTVRSEYVNHTVVNSTIPGVTQDLFTSGTKLGTVSSLLDIEFRAYNLDNNQYIDNNATRPVGRLEVLPSVILDSTYHIVEGLIIDSFAGGVGFRNHTVPAGLELGATWTEDILWVVPETKCTNTNLSLHFSVNNNVSVSMSGTDGYLRDDGGFSEISSVLPVPRWNEGDTWKNVTSVPQLKQGADILAWWNNQFTAQALNLTESAKGAIYRGQLNTFGALSEPGAIKISSMDGQFLDDIYYDDKTALAEQFKNYGIRCSGYYDDDQSIDGKSFMQCGYLYTIPRPENEGIGQSWRPDPGSAWSQDLYTCASSVSATIKEVTFNTSGSTSLVALQVLDVKDKAYSNTTGMPIWGIESVNSSAYKVWDVYKFWGLVDNTATQSPDVVAQIAPKMYLPAAVRGPTLGSHMYDSFAGGAVFTAAWNSIYAWAAAFSDVNALSLPNYSGKYNYGLTLKWRQLSGSAENAETLLNLIWTDLVAFSVVGTRTGFENMGETSSVTDRQPGNVGIRRVYKYQRSIKYEDIRYAIPAFIVGGILVIAFSITLVMCCVQRQAWRALRHYMNQTSMGRAMLQSEGDEFNAYASTNEWAREARDITLKVPDFRQEQKKGSYVPANIKMTSTTSVSEGGTARSRESSVHLGHVAGVTNQGNGSPDEESFLQEHERHSSY
ncbi:hypothetical protein LTS07_001806 [Exophiala sideris]|uniref:Peptidase A1 domain-containing protein n=1 Tax=Exophiala sideris TaxID=1016849 RepID=A0ABR0JPC2_9EURO|nr:hypothetical protein LTS07_001806 [Exophiala sideris]KAK5044320.1 hypothetical protein LTR13_000676 [Exophiala sideris]KAK5067820.1 hypothetical protein LTR69_001809 [Exophiala sideris]KAK5183938.1 hypothetical protein LTR44_003443 [Eurotiomycetes sp. CCFEE 6388]